MSTMDKRRCRESCQEIFEAIGELSTHFLDEALRDEYDEELACFYASARLVRALERERLLPRPARPAAEQAKTG